MSSNKKKPRSTVRRIFRALFFAYVSVVIVLAFFQRYLMYHPRTASEMPVASFRDVTRIYPAATDVRLTCSDGVQIGGWLLQKEAVDGDNAKRPLLIFFHGNAGHRAWRIDWYRIMANADVDVLAIDYHGYGDSSGKMTEEALEIDADAAWNFATKELKYKPEQLLVMGTSLGGAAAVYLASKQCRARNPPAALVAVATFSSMVDVAGSHYPWLPVGAVLVDRYPSDERVAHVTCPVVMFHGDKDRVVPYKFGARLFDAVPEKSASGVPKRWVNLPGVGHNDIVHRAARPISEQIHRLAKQGVGKP